jgi:DNA-binding MarR family transcriptional regulator
MIGESREALSELVRMLVRNLGILERGDASCCGITTTQCHTLVEIGRIGQGALVELASSLCVDKSTMSRTIDNLVEAGYALRDQDSENRRYVAIRLSQSGKQAYESIEESLIAYYDSILESIPEAKREQVLESLRLITDALKSNKCLI